MGSLKSVKSRISLSFTTVWNTVEYIDKKLCGWIQFSKLDFYEVFSACDIIVMHIMFFFPNKKEIIHSLTWWGLVFLRWLLPFCFLRFMDLASFSVCCWKDCCAQVNTVPANNLFQTLKNILPLAHLRKVIFILVLCSNLGTDSFSIKTRKKTLVEGALA